METLTYILIAFFAGVVIRAIVDARKAKLELMKTEAQWAKELEQVKSKHDDAKKSEAAAAANLKNTKKKYSDK